MDAVEFGQYMKELRLKKKYSVRKLGMMCGLSHGYVSNMERGTKGIPKPDTLRKIAPALNVTPEELMIKAGHMEEPKDAMMNMIDMLNKAKIDGRTVNLDEYDQLVIMIDGHELSELEKKKFVDDIRSYRALLAAEIERNRRD